MLGPLVIKQSPKNNKLHDLYDFDNIIIVVTDWNRESSIKKYLAHYHKSKIDRPTSLLINGLGKFLETSVENKTGKYGNMLVSTFVVKKVLRYINIILNLII